MHNHRAVLMSGLLCGLGLVTTAAAADAPANPWKARVPAVLARAEAGGADDLREALDVAWHADDWRAGLKLARLAQTRHEKIDRLFGPRARALWRAGEIEAAERLREQFRPQSDDPLEVRLMMTIDAARGRTTDLDKLADRLTALAPRDAESWSSIAAVDFARGRIGRVAESARRAIASAATDGRYPDHFVAESLTGVPEFVAAIGSAETNRVTRFGAARMPPLPLLGLPCVDAYINGKGPYRLVVDTGGSVLLSIDNEVAEEIGLKSIASASVRGVGGLDESGQALADSLTMGEIRCERVLTRIFAVRGATMNAADGIIGTGIFREARMMLHWQRGELVLAPSTDAPGAGDELPTRIIADAKLIVSGTIQGEPARIFLDSGADVVALSQALLEKHFPDKHVQMAGGMPIGVGSGALPQISMSPGVNIRFGTAERAREFRNYSGLGLDTLDATISPILGMQIDALAGMAVMREMDTLTVDYPRARLWAAWRAR